MALTSRLLSKSKQQYGAQIVFPKEHGVLVRYFSKEDPSKVLKGDDMLKGIFLEVKNKFETALGVLRKEKITIDPDDSAAAQQYADVMKTVREKADLLSESQRIKYTIDTQTQGAQDAHTYLLTLQEIRIKRGLTDDLGAKAMMFEALDKVEKEMKKSLMRNYKKGLESVGMIYPNEEQLENNIAKAQLEKLKKDVLEAMETLKKKEEFKDEEMVDVKSLDIRNFL